MTMPQMPNPFGATPQTRDVLLDVAQERRRQIEKGWTPDHDDTHSPEDMAHLAGLRVDNATLTSEPPQARRALIQAVAILVAAVESMDRHAADDDG